MRGWLSASSSLDTNKRRRRRRRRGKNASLLSGKHPPRKLTGMQSMLSFTLIPSVYSFLMSMLRRARRRRNASDDDEDDDGASSDVVADEDSDVEMADARPSKRKSDMSEGGKQTRAERLSARTQAKVWTTRRSFKILLICFYLDQERLSTGGKKATTPSDEADD